MVVAPTPKELEYMKVHIKDDKRASVIVVNVICSVAAVFSFALRITARRLRKVAVKLDDYLMLVALVGRLFSECWQWY